MAAASADADTADEAIADGSPSLSLPPTINGPHSSVTCDGCGTSGFSGYRYKCLVICAFCLLPFSLTRLRRCARTLISAALAFQAEWKRAHTVRSTRWAFAVTTPIPI